MRLSRSLSAFALAALVAGSTAGAADAPVRLVVFESFMDPG